jgi:hypothetical protein
MAAGGWRGGVGWGGVGELEEIEVWDSVEGVALPGLKGLFATAWRTAERTVGDVKRMLSGSDLVVALCHRRQRGVWWALRGS